VALYFHLLRSRGSSWIALILLLSAPSLFAQTSTGPAAKANSRLSDEWDVAMAADGFEHIYVLYPQYQPVPGCASCAPRPVMTLVMSDDNGATWQAPRPLTPPSPEQVTPAIAVDNSDHKTLYATWLERGRQDVVLAKSSDFGQSWSVVVAARAVAAAEKPVVAASGQNVYLAFTREQKMWVASSHDGGITFALTSLEPAAAITETLAGGATVDPQGNAYIAWSAYIAPPPGWRAQINLYISKSADGGKSWSSTRMDVSNTQPQCAGYNCKWGYLGAQISIASDSAGTLYAFWNSSPLNAAPPAKDPARVYFSTSTTFGETWSPKVSISDAPAGTNHVLPTIAAGSAGDVRVAWIDSRHSPDWSAFYRTSTNGGATWSPEEMISTYLPTTSYIPPEEFDTLFGGGGTQGAHAGNVLDASAVGF
jgi:BNR repeat-like domain